MQYIIYRLEVKTHHWVVLEADMDGNFSNFDYLPSWMEFLHAL